MTNFQLSLLLKKSLSKISNKAQLLIIPPVDKISAITKDNERLLSVK